MTAQKLYKNDLDMIGHYHPKSKIEPAVISTAQEHINFLHRQSHKQAFVKIERLNPQPDQKRWYTWRVSQKPSGATLAEIANSTDIFTSINPLYHFKRSNSNVSNHNFLWVDMDAPEGAADSWYRKALDEISSRIFDEGVLPYPSAYVLSGRGVWLLYRLDGTSSTQHSKERADFNRAMKTINRLLRPWGADPAAVDPARLTRLAGSINSKNGNRVIVLEADPTPFNLQEFTETYCHGTEAVEWAQSPQPIRKSKEDTQRSHRGVSRSTGKNTGTLLKARMADFRQLVELRQGNMTGMRNFLLYSYAYHALRLYGTDPQDTLEDIKRINERYTDPIPDRKLVNTFASALMRNPDYKLKTNSNLIAELAITEEEQRHMKTIISPAEKHRRRTAKRRAAGIKPREEYQQDRKKKQQERVQQLQRLIEENPDITNKQLQELLKVSKPTIHRLKKLLK